MRKSFIIWMVAIILVLTAIYSVKTYNGKNSSAENPEQQSEKTEQSIKKPDISESDNTDQSANQQEQNRTNLMEEYDFTLEDLNGDKVSLSQLKGKKIFLNFWATWCPPCKGEMPDMEKLYQEIKGSELVILAVNVGEEKETVEAFISKNNYSFPVLLDSSGDVSKLYHVSGIPTSYFIDTEGYLDYGITGGITLEKMKEYTDNLK